MKIACLTYAGVDPETTDDALLATLARARGHTLTWVQWDDASVDLRKFDAAILRSTWDYFQRIPEFLIWLERCESQGVRLFNPVSQVRWNLHKRYLLELERKGIPTAPLWVGTQGESTTLAAVVASLGTEDVVVKPAISGGAWHTFRVLGMADGEREAKFAEQLAARDVLVQAFLPEIAERGEWSLLYFGGRFSHAVLKRARAGDFRVQHVHGGTIEAREASAALRGLADRTMEVGAPDALYARVDVVESAAGLRLMELEVIEPWLYFEQGPGSPERFLDALELRVTAGS